ncbi:MAG: hypothetical protein PUB22_01005 [Clostridiales bacterium]|nr:hypothetical protein [Clostridiales bacterium]
MKKPYIKPMICVEELQMDSPIAANCIADKDDMNSLIELGYFADHNCSIIYDEKIMGDSHDTICYHSNVQTAFLS